MDEWMIALLRSFVEKRYEEEDVFHVSSEAFKCVKNSFHFKCLFFKILQRTLKATNHSINFHEVLQI